MKTITIPSNYDPFKIDINGVHYEYRGGETVEVPDEVADLIENIIANEPKENPEESVWEAIAELRRKIAELETSGASKEYVDNGLATKLSLSGGKMTGNIDMDKYAIDNVQRISMIKDKDGNYPEILRVAAGHEICIKGLAEPGGDHWAATKKYVDDTLIVDTNDEVE